MEIKKISFSYGEKTFINGLSGKIEKGKITTILGPNGCGKSTLLNLMSKHLKADAGVVTLDGVDMRKISIKEMAKNIAMVHQQNTVPMDTTVERLVSFGRMPYQTMFSEFDEDGDSIVKWALEITNLSHIAKKRVGQLSGGERQRAFIALALAQKTDILFLDEPTTYLDIFYQLEILNLVKRLNREYGITIVMVLHDINQAMQYSDNLIIMKKGNICYSGDVESGITSKRLKEVYNIDAMIKWSDENNCPYIIPITGRDILDIAV